MPEVEQVLRIAIGRPDGHQSRPWRIWVPKRKSDLYLSARRVASSVKVSLHEPGPARFALTSEWVRRTGFAAPAGKDRRLAVEWERPRPQPPGRIARPFTIIIPWDEVRDRPRPATGVDIWIAPPPDGHCLHLDVVHTPAGALVSGHPGARSMGTVLAGEVSLENGERVFITALPRPISDGLRRQITTLRNARIRDHNGLAVTKTGMLAFGTEPNPDASDGTQCGIMVDITRDG